MSESVAALPFLRTTPCQCGELPMLVDGVYVCTCPACPSYDEEAWEAPEAVAV